MRTSINPTIADSDLIRRVGIAYATRPRIARHDFQVSVHAGVVTLHGKLPTSYDRHLVVAVTRHVAGVFAIVDNLTVDDLNTRYAEVLENPTTGPYESIVPRAPRRRRLRLSTVAVAGVAAAVAAFVGCGSADDGRPPVHPVSGAVTFRGHPATGAFVALHPKQGDGAGAPSPRATVGTDGKFSLTTYDGEDGAPQGEYVLTVQWYKPVQQGKDFIGGPNVLPVKYANPRTSDLTITVAAGANSLKPIQLR